ncbi:MAG: hypothetical protein WA191_07035 [Telluria sp.]
MEPNRIAAMRIMAANLRAEGQQSRADNVDELCKALEVAPAPVAAPQRGREWSKHVADAWKTLRTHNSSIPDDVLDAMRAELLAPVAAPTDLHAAIMNLPCITPNYSGVNCGHYYRIGHRDARHGAAELVAAAEGAPVGAPEGHALAPHYRGYAHLGTGQYVMNHSAESPAEFIISVATEAEKAGRVVGDERDNAPCEMLHPEAMCVRIRFENVAGLDAMEKQLKYLRAAHFSESAATALTQMQAVAGDVKDAAIALWNETGDRLQKADDTLRNLSSYVGQGGCWDTENLDYDEMASRIKEGIDAITNVEKERATSVVEKSGRLEPQAVVGELTPLVQILQDIVSDGYLSDTQTHRARTAIAMHRGTPAAPAVAVAAQDVRGAWSDKSPTEQAWYWHWNGDADSRPIPTSVMYSGTGKWCFVSSGQIGLNAAVWCHEYGGYWMRMHEPAIDAAILAAKGVTA